MTEAYGEWRSPLSASAAAASVARFGNVHLGATIVAWTESLPDDGGRMSIRYAPAVTASDDHPTGSVDGGGEAGRPAAREFRRGQIISARSRVNEYGGGSFWMSDEGPAVSGAERVQPMVAWVDSETQRINHAGMDGPARVLTPAPLAVRGLRYAAGVMAPGGAWMFVERESHVDGHGRGLPEPVNDLVSVRVSDGEVIGGDVIGVVGPANPGGGDFTAAPRLSPDGRTLAWLRWDHPDMPWDAAELWAGAVTYTGLGPQVSNGRRVAGGHGDTRSDGLGRAVSVCLPEWSNDGVLWWCDDADDWWHLRHAPRPGLPEAGAGESADLAIEFADEEVGEPRWVSGGCRYGFTADGMVVFVATSGGLDGLWVADLATGGRRRVPGPEFTYVESISVRGNRVAAIAGTPLQPTSVWLIDLEAGSAVDLRAAEPVIDPEWTSRPESITFDTDGGAHCHGLLYRPTRPDPETPPTGLPPLVVRIHGGPTANARSEFSTSIQYWTTRGFAVVDVNYRGSTGFGRRYRDALRGLWGVADVRDCLAAVRYLADEGIVDRERCVIRGGSAGGFTALAAICFQAEWGFDDTLAAACSLYGVTDLASLAQDTHKFESRYLDGLVGEYPAKAELYRRRSPLYNAFRLTKPVLLLQGTEDRIVPQSQAEVLVNALEANGVRHAYVLFEGEGHGFVNGTTIVEALQTELAFYGAALGFSPAGDLPTIDLH